MSASTPVQAITGTGSVCFDESLVRRYGGRGPRYTSYPTALQFDDAFGASDLQQHALASNEQGKPLSLYVHIPFCRALCYYCACNKIVTRNAGRVATYMQRLARETELQGALFDYDRKVEQLHFGGGTPTYLDAMQLRLLMGRLRRSFNFETSERREFSIEVDPRTVDTATMIVLAELGFNRLSLGIQDFDPKVQLAVNRMQSAEDVAALLEAARDLEFRSVSFDLIYGLPHQTVATFDRTLDQVIEMRPDRLAIYNYAHLPERFKGQRMIRDEDIPEPGIKLDILKHTIEKLCAAGYVYIGMDHFALPDDELVRAKKNRTLQRNFQGYSTHSDCDLVALGVSAIGRIGPAFYQNTPSTKEYESILEAGALPVTRGIVTNRDDELRAAVIREIMCYDGVDPEEFGTDFGIDFRSYFSTELERLDALAMDDLLDITTSRIGVTPKGRLLLRSIAMVFDRYLTGGEENQRFSRAI